MTTPDLKGAGMCNFDFVAPQMEENQRTAFLMTTEGLAFPRVQLRGAFRALINAMYLYEQAERKRILLCYILLF